jgi:ketosteroid isomerase-like protein
MKRILSLTAVFIVLAVPAVAQRTSAEHEVLQVELAWNLALEQGDVAALERIWADEFLDTSFDGSVTTKKEDLAVIASRDLVYQSSKVRNLVIRVYGKSAVVTGHWTAVGQFRGADVSGEFRYTDVYVKREGRWQAVASQITRIGG